MVREEITLCTKSIYFLPGPNHGEAIHIYIVVVLRCIPTSTHTPFMIFDASFNFAAQTPIPSDSSACNLSHAVRRVDLLDLLNDNLFYLDSAAVQHCIFRLHARVHRALGLLHQKNAFNVSEDGKITGRPRTGLCLKDRSTTKIIAAYDYFCGGPIF